MRENSRSRFWAFVSDNIVALSTVVAGVGVVIWHAIVDPSNLDPVSAAILGLLCLLATSEVVEGRKRLDRIQATIDQRMTKILTLLPMAEIRRFPDAETALEYLSNRSRGVRVSIDHASIDLVARSRAKKAREKFLQVRSDLIKGGEVRYRYLFRADERRTEWVKQSLSTAVAGKFFAAGLPLGTSNIPMMIFSIWDGEEVIVRSPYEVGEGEVYVSIRQPDIVTLFSQWFNRLWASATKIDTMAPYEQQVAEIDRLLQLEN